MKKGLLIGGLALFGMIILMVFALAFCASILDTSAPKKKEIDVSINQKQNTGVKTANSYEDDRLKFTILSTEFNYQEKYMSKDNEENKVVAIKVSLKNKQKDNMFIHPFLAKANNKMLTRYYGGKNHLTLNDVLPDTATDGMVYFEYPPSTKKISLIYEYGFIDNNQLIFNIDVK